VNQGGDWQRSAWFLLRGAITVAVLSWLVSTLGGARTLASQLLALPALTVLAVLVVNTIDRLLMAYKWLRLLRAAGEDLTLLGATQIYCASMVWGMFLPATVGADAVRVVCARRRGVGGSTGVASILVERALGFLASLLLGLAGLAVIASLRELPAALEPAVWGGALLFAGGALLLGLSLSERTFTWLDDRLYKPLSERTGIGTLRRVHESYRAFRRHRGELRLFFGLSLLEQLVPALSVWLLAVALGDPPSPLYLAAAVAISYVVARVPISFGGIGILEGVLVFLLVLGGMSGERALAVSVASRIIEVLSWLPWWITFVAATGNPRPPREARS